MKTGFVSLAALVFGAIALSFWLLSPHSTNVPIPGQNEGNKQTNAAGQQTKTDSGSMRTEANSGGNASNQIANRIQQMQAESNKIQNQWRTPIEFYGKVVDEANSPVEDAQIIFSCNDLSETGTSDYKAKSDASGLFSIKDITGKLLTVHVHKDGYYSSSRDNDSYYYAGQNVNFRPDMNIPVVFHLRKIGKGAELLTSQKGMNPQLGISVPKDGTSVKVDLIQKQTSPSGQLEISQNKPPWQGATNWSFRLSIPDGGLVENQDEYQFEAPASGYQPALEYDFVKTDTNWTTQVTKQFYIMFGNPPRYGSLSFQCNLRQQTVFLTYAINPDGSRNLEPQQ
jgi:hypothetical protein